MIKQTKALWIRPALIVTISFFLLLLAIWELMNSRKFQIFGRLVHGVEDSPNKVALTFDDGPVPGATEQILKILADAKIKATFFVTGRELSQSPHLGRAIVEAGHQLGNHSWSHQRMVFKSAYWIADEVSKTNALIRDAGYQGDIVFRPPYGKKLFALPWVLSKFDMTTIMWNSEPDSRDLDSAEITQEALKNLRGGSIVLLHVMYPSRKASLDSVAQIIAAGKARGLKFVTVEELIKAPQE